MAKTRTDLDRLIDRLEDSLPRLILQHPDADGADFWLAFAEHSVFIEGCAGTADAKHVRARLDLMLESRGLIPSDDASATLVCGI